MPRSPTGTSSIPVTFTPDTPAKASEVNANFTDVASQLTDSLSRSGKGGMQAILNMGGFKVTNAGAPTIASDLVTKGYGDASYATTAVLGNYLLKTGGTLTGALVIQTSTGAPLTIQNTAASINTALRIQNTLGSFYIGRSGSSFYISENANIATSPMLQVTTAGQTTISTSTGVPLIVANTAATINTAIQYTNSTPGSVYAGISSGTYYVSDSANLSTSPRFSVDNTGLMTVANQVNVGATGFLSGSGNVGGSFWSDWGSTQAKAAIDSRITDRVGALAPPTSRTISAGGLLTGGGSLAADRTITLTAASQAQAEAGTNTTTAMTPQRVAQAIAALTPLPPSAIGAVGTYAMLVNTTGNVTPGQQVSGTLLYYSSSSGNTGANPPGAWRCMGAASAGAATLWYRYV